MQTPSIRGQFKPSRATTSPFGHGRAFEARKSCNVLLISDCVARDLAGTRQHEVSEHCLGGSIKCFGIPQCLTGVRDGGIGATSLQVQQGRVR